MRLVRRLLAVAGVAGVMAAPAAGGPPIQDTSDSATVIAVPSVAGARPAVLRLSLHYEMLCAQPGKGPVIVTLPSALRVPSSIAASTVLLKDKAAPSVQVEGHVVTIGLEPNSNVICQSYVPSTLLISFTRSARLGNPLRSGHYLVRARVGSHSFSTRLIIRAKRH
jgi:hypothetical protein